MAARTTVGLMLGMVIGAGVAVQGRINGALGARLHDGIAAATVSFGVGLAVLLLIFLLHPQLRAGVVAVARAVRSGRLRPWQLLGGLCGATFVASQGLTVAAVGVTAFTVAVVSGQLLSSLVVDRLGLGPSGRTPLTRWRIGGAAVAVIAVAVAGLGGASETGTLAAPELIADVPVGLLLVLPALAGVGLAWQQAVNGQVGMVRGPFPAAGVNFTVGFIALCAMLAVLTLRSGLPTTWPTEPWLYLGGVIGVGFIAAAVLVVRWIGVLLLGLTTVSGQLLTALLLDVLTPTGAGLSVATVAGCVLTLLAVGVAAGIPRRIPAVS